MATKLHDVNWTIASERLFYPKVADDEDRKQMRAISLAEANRIIGGTFASARKRRAHALAAICSTPAAG